MHHFKWKRYLKKLYLLPVNGGEGRGQSLPCASAFNRDKRNSRQKVFSVGGVL